MCNAHGRQVRERYTKLEDFASWLAGLQRVQGQEGQRQQAQETALALWDMYLAYGGKPLLDQQEKFDEMKEDAAVFQKVPPLAMQGCMLIMAANILLHGGSNEVPHRLLNSE